MSELKPFHHYLAATQVVFIEKGIRNQMGINALLVIESSTINQHAIGHIQQVAQVTFYRITGKNQADTNIVDVFIQGISYLGLMTEEDFRIRPEIKEEEVRNAINSAISRGSVSEEPADAFASDPSGTVAQTSETPAEEAPQPTSEPVVVQDEPVDQVSEEPIVMAVEEASRDMEAELKEAPEESPAKDELEAQKKQVDIEDGTKSLNDLPIPKN